MYRTVGPRTAGRLTGVCLWVVGSLLVPVGAGELKVRDLPDFSWAGYHAGAKALPELKATAKARAIDVRDHGGVGDGRADDTAALKSALAAAARGGGVVAIPPGRWVLTDVLPITTSGVVLKGAGATKTILVCPKSLSDIRGPNRNWSWSGGMVEVAPPRGRRQVLARVVRKAAAGTRQIVVEFAGPARPRAGEWLEMQWYNDKGKDSLLDHLFGGVVPRERMGTALQQSNSARVREWVRIEAVHGQRLRLAQPLRIDARPQWRPTLLRRPFVQEVGIQGLSFEFPETIYPGHLREKGYNAIYIQGLVNGWVRDVRITNADCGIVLGACKHVTVCDVLLRGRTMHHGLCISFGSDCLFTRWRIEAPHIHGTTISWAAHGNVFSQGWGRNLAMDAHRAASFQNLHTAVTIEYGNKPPRPFRSGGSRPRGPHSAGRNVYWNIDNRFPTSGGTVQITGYDEWPLGIFVGWHGNRKLLMPPVKGMRQQVVALNEEPAIADLHQYQLKARLGR